jgi:hypothetical protein
MVTAFGLKQFFSAGSPVTVYSYPHAFSAHWEKPPAPHFAVAADNSRHSQGATQVITGTGVMVACTGNPRAGGAAPTLTIIPARQSIRITDRDIRYTQVFFPGFGFIDAPLR